MRFTDIFIRRPILAIVVSMLIFLVGLASVFKLNVHQFPKSDSAVVVVTTTYVGASANLVKGFITTPLEREIASADGIDYIESSSRANISEIKAHLRLNYDQNDALAQISAKINRVKNELPPESEDPVINIETPDNQIAAMYLGFYSESLEANQTTDYLVRVVQPRLSSVAGVQKAEILGARTFAMRIWLRPHDMAANALTPSDVYNALRVNNYLSALGNTKSQMISVNLTANTDLQSEEDFKELIIKEVDGAIVRLGDIADVILGAEDYDNAVRFDGVNATFMGIWVLPNANSLDVIKRVREVIPQIDSELPTGLKLGVPYDSTLYIEDAIEEIITTLLETLAIVVLIIFLFLGSIRSVLIPVVAMPLSLIGATILMLLCGFTVNLLTLLAIVLSVGLVVDDAIVVLENVERHIRLGKKPFQAAIDAARELVGPIIAMTITLAAVYAPIGFQGGLTGTLFREFAFTLAGAVVISGIVALTLSPMMSSRILPEEHDPKGMAAWLDAKFDRLKAFYGKCLGRALNNRFIVNLLAFLTILLLPIFYMFSPKELAPQEDQGVLFGIVQGAPNATIDQTTVYTEQMNEIYEAAPETKNTFQVTFPGNGFSGLVTKPWSERSRTTQEMLPEIQGKISSITGLEVFATTPAPLPGGSNFPVEFVIASTASSEELYGIAQQLLGKAMASQKFMFAFSDLRYDRPETEVMIDRDKAALMGLNMQDIGFDLSAAIGGNYVNRFSIQGRSYKVIPQIKRMDRMTAEQLKDIHVRAGDGTLVSLDSFIHLKDTVQARELKRFQQLNSVMIQASPFPGVTIDDALLFLEEEAAALFPEGKGYRVDYAGESRQLRTEGNSFLFIICFAAAFIFLVLSAQFESFRDPFIILLGSVPLALVGAMLFTFYGFTSINIYSQVGLVTLVGLVSKNGILIVEFANDLQRKGMSKWQAVHEASTIRLRPILMTTAATVFGHMPLVFVTGAGAAARNSIGLVLVTGMAIGTIFTLFVVPSIYVVVGRNLNRALKEGEGI